MAVNSRRNVRIARHCIVGFADARRSPYPNTIWIMATFGDVAVRAAKLVGEGTCRSAPEAWMMAVGEVFAHSESMREKSCPRSTFLGLCEEGLVAGVPAGTYTRSRDNKAYGVQAAGLLARDPTLASGGWRTLWTRVLGGRSKQHNSQMDIVLALHQHGLLVHSNRSGAQQAFASGE
jgi:hypothetical protein